MAEGRIVIVTGTPGTGKTTAAELLAMQTDKPGSVHMVTDDFYHHLKKGMIPPYLDGSQEQNGIVIEAFCEAAKRYARGGYDVIVDGIIGPWFLAPWLAAVREGYEVHYAVLRAPLGETLRRAAGRVPEGQKPDTSVVEIMWPQFADLGEYERCAVDTARLTAQETVTLILQGLSQGSFRLA